MTERITHNLVQGTDEWAQFRLTKFGASEAASMLGISTKAKRTELLHMKHTGNPKEFSDWVQKNILDYGHEVEALARPIVEEIIGQDLYPVTRSMGMLSASCDGLTLDDETAFEHKQWNEALAESVRAKVLPDEYQPQCQQIMMVHGAKRVIFVVSDGTRENMEYMEVCPDPAWQERIVAGWAQFEKDLAEYVPAVIETKPEGRTPETLPALLVEVTGRVTASNLREYREHALAVFAGINRELTTDQHFADAEKTVKWCGMVEERLAAAKQHALSQTASIDELFRTIDDISAEARRVRLDLDKLVTRRKVEVKESIIKGGRDAFAAHVQALKDETNGAFVQMGMPDFAGAAKGKRSVASIQDAVDTLLANSKIEADAAAKRIRDNIAFLDGAIKGYEFLFADRVGLSGKQLDDLKLVVSARIDKHKLDEQRKEEEQRERIRREEQAKLERQQRDAQEAEDALVTSIWKNARRIEADNVLYIQKAIGAFESIAGDWENDPRPRVAEAVASARDEMQAKLKAAEDREAAPVASPAPAPTPAPTQMAARPAQDAPRSTAPVTPIARGRSRQRPTDADIIEALSIHFGASQATVIEWLREMHLPAAA